MPTIDMVRVLCTNSTPVETPLFPDIVHPTRLCRRPVEAKQNISTLSHHRRPREDVCGIHWVSLLPDKVVNYVGQLLADGLARAAIAPDAMLRIEKAGRVGLVGIGYGQLLAGGDIRVRHEDNDIAPQGRNAIDLKVDVAGPAAFMIEAGRNGEDGADFAITLYVDEESTCPFVSRYYVPGASRTCWY